MKTTTRCLIAFTAFLMIAISCNKDDDGGSSSGNSDAKRITSFTFTLLGNEALEAQGYINEEANAIAVSVPYGTNITALSPVVEVSQGASYSPEGGRDFTEQVIYTVTAQNGTTTTYEVTVTVAPNTENEIGNFLFSQEDNEHLSQDINASIDNENNTITTVMQFGTNVTNLTPTLEVSPEATVEPEGAQDFTEPITYTVTAQDGTSAEYTVTVIVAENDDVKILSFQFLANVNDALTQNVNTVINTDDHTITTTVPYGTIINALVPAITTSAGAVYIPSGAQNFSSPVMYTVTTANGEITHTYTVTVTIEEPAGALALQWQALMDIYEASYDGFYQVHYLNWEISNPDISTWEGITTDADGYVTELILTRKITTNQIPESIDNLIRLQVLNITENELTTLPTSIGNLSQLRQLILGPNQLTVLPSTIGGLSRLQELHINNCKLTDFPASFSDLKALQVLDIGRNNFTEVPESLQGIAGNLISLNMSENDLSGGLPEWIGDFAVLEELNLYNCRLTGLPDTYKEGWLELRVLDLGGAGSNKNQLAQFPLLLSLIKIERLSLKGNGLEFTSTLVNLDNLTHLDLSNNKFMYFPNDIVHLSEVQWLNMRNNLFEELPEDLIELENLTYIDIRDNNLGMLSGDLCEYLVGIEENFMDPGTCP